MESNDEQRRVREDRISMREWGSVLERLRAQDVVLIKQNAEIESMRNDIRELLEMANRGKGGLMMLMSIGSIAGAVVGWVIEHLVTR